MEITLYSTEEVADIIKKSRVQVRRYCRSGAIKGCQMVGRDWVIWDYSGYKGKK